MVKDMSEKIIKLPISEWIIQSAGFKTDLPPSTYCICYQYNINENGYGPYGFATEKSKGLLSFLFTDLMFFNKEKKSIDFCSVISTRGLYFYGSNKLISQELNEYRKKILKNKLKFKREMLEEVEPEKPEILSLYNNEQIETSVLKFFFKKECLFLFKCFLTPIAGDTLIVFDPEIWRKATEYCNNNSIETQSSNSIDDLKEW